MIRAGTDNSSASALFPFSFFPDLNESSCDGSGSTGRAISVLRNCIKINGSFEYQGSVVSAMINDINDQIILRQFLTEHSVDFRALAGLVAAEETQKARL